MSYSSGAVPAARWEEYASTLPACTNAEETAARTFLFNTWKSAGGCMTLDRLEASMRETMRCGSDFPLRPLINQACLAVSGGRVDPKVQDIRETVVVERSEFRSVVFFLQRYCAFQGLLGKLDQDKGVPSGMVGLDKFKKVVSMIVDSDWGMDSVTSSLVGLDQEFDELDPGKHGCISIDMFGFWVMRSLLLGERMRYQEDRRRSSQETEGGEQKLSLQRRVRGGGLQKHPSPPARPPPGGFLATSSPRKRGRAVKLPFQTSP